MPRKASPEMESLQKRLKVSDEDRDLLNERWTIFIANKKSPKNSVCYAKRSIGGRKNRQVLILHRVIMERVLGRKLLDHEKVDHIDYDGLNNRRDNIRVLTHGQNVGRCRIKSHNTSGSIGVHYCAKDKGWRAAIQVNRKRIHLGAYKEKIHAVIAYDAIARLLKGPLYELTVFPDGVNPFVITKSH